MAYRKPRISALVSTAKGLGRVFRSLNLKTHSQGHLQHLCKQPSSLAKLSNLMQDFGVGYALRQRNPNFATNVSCAAEHGRIK
jgi:hypothetical protein